MIKRLRVTEGFLDGLDLEFTNGLNVIIGPRGAGKTSVLELLRFGLGVAPFTSRGQQASERQVSAVLAGGKVIVDVQFGDQTRVYSREADSAEPRVQGEQGVAERPTMLAHDEVEALAGDADGRLRLIDSFRPHRAQHDPDERPLLLELRSLTKQLHQAEDETHRLDERLSTREALESELTEAAAAELTLLNRTEVDALRTQLDAVTTEVSRLAVRKAELERGTAAAASWSASVLQSTKPTPFIARADGEDFEPAAHLQRAVDRAEVAVSTAIEQLKTAIAQAHQHLAPLRDRHEVQTEKARGLRQALEQLQTGAGDAARRTAGLRAELDQLNSLAQVRAAHWETARIIRERREGLLDELDENRSRRTKQRQDIVDSLNRTLGPRIRIELEPAASRAEYAANLMQALKGAGVQYSPLAAKLSAELTPRELVAMAEAGDSALLATRLSIPVDRAERVVSRLRRQGTAEILTSPIQDLVVLKLLTGDHYKPSDQLSTGQRCTVVLPILLVREGSVLSIDQPEDNLDNAFVVDTLVRSLLSRRSGQLIFSTHNPNIPVLGEAERVVSLRSDGRRGFIHAEGRLDFPPVVDAITSVMEGGREAFARRADFYDAGDRRG